MNSRILIIDDDEKLNRLLTVYLGKMGFEVLTATLPSQGLEKLESEVPDLVILDVMLPEMDGFEVCRAIRQSSTVPVIMLTARGEVMDRVVGLELGADDYLPKPFEPRELVARIQSVLRRVQAKSSSGVKKIGNLSIDFHKLEVTVDNKPAGLTSSEFECLVLLVKNSGKVLNRDQIIEHLRGIEWDAFNRSVDITMSRLRQKLGDDPKNPRFIKTIWGTGYLFIGGENEA
ncbi:MAG TPA: response regulator transcription factor [Candidatus Lambdaproteobacteria bacterium]|nr:response regulator transcription factor [Candidatus Lambdaproteobacteria bacterium]